MSGAVFVNLSDQFGGGDPVGPFVVDGLDQSVGVSTSYAHSGVGPFLCGAYTLNDSPNNILADPAVDPGDFRGRFASWSGSGNQIESELVFDFDPPISGFGVTVLQQHFINGPTEPDTLVLYTEPGASGEVISSVTSIGAPAFPKNQIDFVGVYVSENIVRSAKLISGAVGQNRTLFLDGFALQRISGGNGCSVADLADPLGVLNFFDVAAYLAMYNANDPAADLAEPTGVLNFFDLAAFIALYNAGCP
jgi:hypothetical protein